MITQLNTAIAATQVVGEKMEAPRPIDMASALVIGVLAAIAAGILHRTDRPTALPFLAPPRRYSIQQALMRAGTAFFGSSMLTLASLMVPATDTSVFILLTAAIPSVVYGLLANSESSVQTAIWKGAKAFAAVATVGHTLLALYTHA
ncbi:hypothetical protein SMICM17S_12408 [Streptomyces microflavus]